MTDPAIRRLFYQKLREFLEEHLHPSDKEFFETGKFNGRPTWIPPETQAELREEYKFILERLEQQGAEMASCGYSKCKKVVRTDDFMCEEHFDLLPVHLRDAYLEERALGRFGNRAFLSTAEAYVSLAVEKKTKRLGRE